jgi:hypothetical protein
MYRIYAMLMGRTEKEKEELKNNPPSTIRLSYPGGIWEIHFMELDDDNNQLSDVTGSGDAFRVFATVLEFTKNIIKSKQPSEINIISDAEEGNRSRLYDRLVRKYASRLGYSVTGTKRNGEDNIISLKKNQVTEEIINEVPSQHRMKFNLKNWKSLKEIRMFLRDNGYKKLGAGVYAEVWKSPTSPEVVKISKEEDQCWIRYVKWIQKQGNNKYLPDIKSFREYELKLNNGKTANMFIAVVETLEDATAYKDELRKRIKQKETLKDIAEWVWLQNAKWNGFGSTIHHLMYNSPLLNSDERFKNLDANQRAEKLLKMFGQTQIAKTHSKIKRELSGAGCEDDLHFGNLMYRPLTKNLVITDPLASALTNVNESVQLKFRTIEINESQIKSYVSKYYDAYDIEKVFHKKVADVKRYSRINENTNSINKYIDYFQSLGIPSTQEIKVGDYFSVLAFDFNFQYNEIEALGFQKPKKISDIKTHNDGTINYIRFEDGDRYPRITPATYSGKPVLYASYFTSEFELNKARSSLQLALPSDWTIDYSSFNENLHAWELSEETLTEARSDSLILVDFQPAYSPQADQDYDSYYDDEEDYYSDQEVEDKFGYMDAIHGVAQYINKHRPNVLAFFNGEEVGIEDTSQQVAWHYIQNGLDEELIHNFKFIEKGYAFLRNWMDQGISDATIIKVIRYMVTNRINDARDIEEEILQELTGNDYQDWMHDESFYIPDISLAQLKKLNGSLLAGGGRHECLREIELLMNAFNIRYKRVDDWIYG